MHGRAKSLVVSVFVQHCVISFEGNADSVLDQTDSALAMICLPDMLHCSCSLAKPLFMLFHCSFSHSHLFVILEFLE